MKPRIVFLYIIMLAGGLWNALGLFQSIMNALASPLIIGLGVWTFIEAMVKLRTIKHQHPLHFALWAFAIVVLSIAVEGLGVHTGLVFGEYSYGDILQPQVYDVPIAIGFAWFTMLVATAAVVVGFGRRVGTASLPVLAAIIAIVMAGFDTIMEPAATALGYWNWVGGAVPFQNYVTWFGLSFIFAIVGLWSKALPRMEFRFGLHVFLAQAGYFILTAAGAYIRGI